MGLADTNRSIKNKVVFVLYKTDLFKIFFGKRRWKLYAAVFISFECFIDRETGAFNQTFSLVLVPAGNFFLKGGGQIFDLLWRAVSLDEFRIAEVRKRDLQQACMLSSISVLAIAVIMKPPPWQLPDEVRKPGHKLQVTGRIPAEYQCHIR